MLKAEQKGEELMVPLPHMQLWLEISMRIAVAPVDDFWNAVGIREPQPDPTVQTADTPEDQMAVAESLKSVA